MIDDRRFKDALLAMRSLEAAGFSARLAGGCVRDRLMGVTPQDYDIATTALPAQVMQLFQAQSLKVVPTGIEHGTVTLVMRGEPIEVTTLRRDVETDGRHAKVVFGASFEDDAARRDFTINALFEDHTGKVFDYFGGQQDLAAKTLRFVGDPRQRIAEDYLRILRLFRFWARLDFAPAEGSLAAVEAGKAGLAQISQERITSELCKLFQGQAVWPALTAMHSTGVLAQVLPEMGDTLPNFAAIQSVYALPANFQPAAMLVLLTHGQTPQTSAALLSLGQRLKLSGLMQKQLAFVQQAEELLLVMDQPSIAASLDFMDACEAAAGESGFHDYIAPLLMTMLQSGLRGDRRLKERLAIVQADGQRYEHRRTADLPLDGRQVMQALGLAPGKDLGVVMAALRSAFRNGEWQSEAEGLEWLSAKY